MRADQFKPINTSHLKYLNQNSLLGVKDIQDIFGYKDRSSITDMMNRGDIPIPDGQSLKGMGRGKPKYLWKASTIISCINKMNQSLEEIK